MLCIGLSIFFGLFSGHQYFSLASADLQTVFAECHLNEAGIGVGLVFQDDFLDACSCLGVFRHHVEETASTSSRQLVAQAEVVDELGEDCDVLWICAAVERLVLQPVLTEQMTHFLELLALDGFVHVECQLLHVA